MNDFKYNLRFGGRKSPRTLTRAYQILLEAHPEVQRDAEVARRFMPDGMTTEDQLAFWQAWLKATQRDLRKEQQYEPKQQVREDES